jgi:hypothetical protein
MYIARWNFTAQFGKVDNVLGILRRWQIDVGERVGWRSSHVRVTTGVLGTSSSSVEMEVRVDSLADLEAAWADMEKNPHHHEHRKQLAHLITGDDKWTIVREHELLG